MAGSVSVRCGATQLPDASLNTSALSHLRSVLDVVPTSPDSTSSFLLAHVQRSELGEVVGRPDWKRQSGSLLASVGTKTAAWVARFPAKDRVSHAVQAEVSGMHPTVETS